MNHSQSLPEPTADALIHSNNLIAVIRDEIDANGKAGTASITFRRYMEMALYQPGLGYYVAGTHKIGQEGDFTTAPEISPLFSQCIANQCAEVLTKIKIKNSQSRQSRYNVEAQRRRPEGRDKIESKVASEQSRREELSKGCLFEFGAGSGKMASEILLELEKQNQLPERYYILDVSPDLIERQRQTLQQKSPHLLDLVEWVSSLPVNFKGVILGNEVMDAMPVDVFTQHGNDIYEHHVIWSEDALVEQLQPANAKLKQQVKTLNIESDKPYTSELNPNLTAWFKALSKPLDEGLILLIDYGYPHSEYYLADRNKGTLICHYQHLVNEAPLVYPGLQDITANVDFTAVAEAADLASLQVSGFTSQAHFLSNTGLEKYFMQALEEDTDNAQQHQYHLSQQVRTLSLPSEMGERFKCIALTKKLDGDLLGFKEFDQRFRL